MYFDIILHYSVQEKRKEGNKESEVYKSYTQPPTPQPMMEMTELMEMILMLCSGSASQP